MKRAPRSPRAPVVIVENLDRACAVLYLGDDGPDAPLFAGEKKKIRGGAAVIASPAGKADHLSPSRAEPVRLRARKASAAYPSTPAADNTVTVSQCVAGRPVPFSFTEVAYGQKSCTC
jgi:hypothetical protein